MAVLSMALGNNCFPSYFYPRAFSFHYFFPLIISQPCIKLMPALYVKVRQQASEKSYCTYLSTYSTFGR
ncbi:hypothetical protein XELAEV_18008983mg [Xenopus laevis]|uniref:Uncharacterized protein n=1 Tax=Xenopus laevis TaxID=8355 RepID=A0A974I0C5_XENLA|nr:hypothetical protein XELAEV_18008983mg [Xenopus laevis]